MADFYKCTDCGAVVLDIQRDAQDCLQEKLELVKPMEGGEKAAKHQPRVRRENGKVVVSVGSDEHPSADDHFVEWILVETSYGGSWYNLNPGDEPVLTLDMNPDEVQQVYAYCNQHGLWKAAEPVLPLDFEQNDVACSPEFALGCVNMTEE